MTLEIIEKEVFETFCNSVSSKSFMQSIEMGELLQKRGYFISYLGLKKQGTLQVATVLFSQQMFGGKRMEINLGPIYHDHLYLKEFYQELKNYAKKNGAIELLVRPNNNYQQFDNTGKPISPKNTELLELLQSLGYQHDGFLKGYPNGEPNWHFIKDLSNLDERSLLKSFIENGRRLVKKSKTFGITLRKLSRDELPLFKDIISATANRRGFLDKNLDYYQDFYDSFGESCEFMVASLNFYDYLEHLKTDKSKLAQRIHKLQEAIKQKHSEKKENQLAQLTRQSKTLETRMEEAKTFISKYGKQDVILAGSLFVYTKQEAVYLFSGSYPEFNKFYAPSLLQEHVMLKAIQLKIPLYNLMGITGNFDGTDGVLRFKQNYNGYIAQKLGSFHYYPRPFKHRFIQILKRLSGRS